MDIKHKFEIKANTQKVYDALTTSEGIKGWWCKDCDIAREVGSVSVMRFDKDGTTVEMQFKITSLQPDHGVSWTCIANPNPAWINTTLNFELSQDGDSSILEFTHGAWDKKWDGEPMYNMVVETWSLFMASIKSYCEEGSGQPW